MTEETCGHPTANGDGPPCQNPAGENGRCWVPTHNDPDADNPHGRAWSIEESDHADILEAAELGASKTGCARAAGAEIDSLNRYLEAHDDFREAFARARARGEQRLLHEPLMQSDDPDAENMDGQHARFILSTSFDYNKTEKRELENTGDEPLGSVSVSYEVVGDDDE